MALDKPEGEARESLLRFERMPLDTVLRIGRDYQRTDSYHGAHWDTLKLLCDTIEWLRDDLAECRKENGDVRLA